MKNMHYRLLVFFLLGLSVCANSQQEATLYFMNGIPQNSYLNPAFIPTSKFSFGIPLSSVYVQYNNNGFS